MPITRTTGFICLVLLCFSIQAQPTAKNIEKINAFNRLFADRFYVDKAMQIWKVNPNQKWEFESFYHYIKDSSWKESSTINLDRIEEMKSGGPNIHTLNLKFNNYGMSFPYSSEEVLNPKKVQEWKSTKTF